MTEAACLLKTGALYTSRIGLRDRSGAMTFAGVKRGAFSLYFDDAPIYHFDLDGRWQRAFIDGVHYRKALDNAVVAIDRVREGANLVLKRRALSFSEVTDLDAAIRQVAIGLSEGIAAGDFTFDPPPEGIRPMIAGDLLARLDRIAGWDANAWFSHRERYVTTYGPVGFLPPDAHQAIVLQATVGDARPEGFGGRPPVAHAVKTPAEFAAHVRDVGRLLGARVLQGSGIFLGGPDVLRRPFADVKGYFEAFRERSREGLRDDSEACLPLSAVDVFLDDLGPGLPDREGLSALKALGLRRVNVGIESGDAGLREGLGASWTGREGVGFVADVKAAGLVMGAIVLVGTGGPAASDRHVEATAELLGTMGLGRGDLVYLVDANEILPGSGLATAEAVSGQTKALKDRLAMVRSNGAKVVPYSLEKQWN